MYDGSRCRDSRGTLRAERGREIVKARALLDCSMLVPQRPPTRQTGRQAMLESNRDACRVGLSKKEEERGEERDKTTARRRTEKENGGGCYPLSLIFARPFFPLAECLLFGPATEGE
jgi:hypothetical protein